MTAKSRSTLNSEFDSNLPDNTTGLISPEDVRVSVKDLADSARLILDLAVQDKATGYTAVAGDRDTLLRFTGTATLSLTAAATLGANWLVDVMADGGDVTIDPNSTETVNGATTALLSDGESGTLYCDGTAFFLLTGGRLPGLTPTKGNLVAGNGTAWVALGVGTDAQVLTADSAEATGVKWADASGGIFTEFFESASQTITSGGSLTLAHGLSSQPKLYLAYLVNTTANIGYSPGDEIHVNEVQDSVNDVGISLVPDSTNINIRYGSRTTVFVAIHKSTGAAEFITNSDWNLIVRAWA